MHLSDLLLCPAAHLIDGTPSAMASHAAYRALRGIPQTRQFRARRCPDIDHLTDAAGHLACARARLGGEDALTAARQGIVEYRSKGQERATPLWLAVLAEALSAVGRPDEGLPLLEEPLGRIERTGEGWLAAELRRLRGELLLALTELDRAAAEDCFRCALALARAQGARMWELRAA
jgi:hypothetical protein